MLPNNELRIIDAYWRAANYLSVGQIYLLDNPLLTEPLRIEHIKPRLLGDMAGPRWWRIHGSKEHTVNCSLKSLETLEGMQKLFEQFFISRRNPQPSHRMLRDRRW